MIRCWKWYLYLVDLIKILLTGQRTCGCDALYELDETDFATCVRNPDATTPPPCSSYQVSKSELFCW